MMFVSLHHFVLLSTVLRGYTGKMMDFIMLSVGDVRKQVGNRLAVVGTTDSFGEHH